MAFADASNYACVAEDLNRSEFDALWVDATQDVSFGSDGVSDPIDLGFELPWIEDTRTQVNISRDGIACLTLDSGGCDEQDSQPTPDTTVPNDLVACGWNDLRFGDDAYARYESGIDLNGTNAFVVTVNADHGASSATVLFQMQILETGTVRCLLDTIETDPFGSETGVGIEGPAGEDGVRYKHENFANDTIAVTFGLVPNAPEGFQATPGPTEREVTLDWQAADIPVDEYRIFRAEQDGDFGSEPNATVSSQTAYIDNGTDDAGLQNETLYHYKIVAVNEVGASAPNHTEARTFGPPSEPRDLDVVRLDEAGALKLNWTVPAALNSTDSYNIYVNGSTDPVASVENAPTETNITNLTSNTEYTFNVTAVNLEGEGPASSTAEGIPLGVPAAPPNTSTSQVTDQLSLDVAWDEPLSVDAPIDDYVLTLWLPDAREVEDNVTLSADTLSQTFQVEECATSYQVNVSATNTFGEGRVSNDTATITGVCPAAPNLTTSATYDEQSDSHIIEVNWTAPESGSAGDITDYRLWTNDGSGWVQAHDDDAVDASNQSYEDANLAPDSTHDYRLQAKNPEGWGPNSTVATNTTWHRPTAPTNPNLKPTAVTGQELVSGDVLLSWDAPQDDGGVPGSVTYTVQVSSQTASGWTDASSPLPGWHDWYRASPPEDGQVSYRIVAENVVGSGPASSEVSTTAVVVHRPAPLEGLSGSAKLTQGGTDVAVDLHWQSPSRLGMSDPTVSSYAIYRYNRSAAAGGADGYPLTCFDTTSETHYTDEELVPGGNYSYTVVALQDPMSGCPTENLLEGRAPAGSSDITLSIGGVPSAPQDLNTTPGPGQGEIELTWTEPVEKGGATDVSYTVYRASDRNGSFQEIADGLTGTSFTDTDLSNDTRKCYEVTATAAGEGPASSRECARTFALPTEPTNLTVTRGDEIGEIELTWAEPNSTGRDFDHYNIYRLGPDGMWEELDTEPTETEYNDTGLADGETFCYNVTAENAVGEGPTSRTECASTFGAPTQPRDADARQHDNELRVDIEWTPPEDDGGKDIESYRVQRSVDGENWTVIDFTPPDKNSTSDEDVVCRTSYSYLIEAENEIGWSPPSETANVTISGACPSPPDNVTAEPGPDTGEITLSWSVPTDEGASDVNQYHIYNATPNASSFSLLKTVPANETTWTHTDLGDNETQRYYIVAENDQGPSLASQDVSATTFARPSAPQDLSASLSDDGEAINLTWEPPEDDGRAELIDYHIYRRNESANTSYERLANLTANHTAFNDTDIGRSSTYCYEVAANNTVGESDRSNEACERTPGEPSPPENVTASSGPDRGEINVSWEAPSPAAKPPVSNYTVLAANNSTLEKQVIATVPSTQLSLVETNLSDSQKRCYQVIATNTEGDSPRSEEACESTFAPPDAPQNVSAEPGPDRGEISLDWDEPHSDVEVEKYSVYRAPNDTVELENYTRIANVSADQTSFVDGDFDDGAERCYYVTATSFNESAPSVTACASTPVSPSEPQNLTANPGPHQGQISLAWDEPADDGGDDVDGYEIYRRDSPDGAWQLIDFVPGGATTYVDSGLDDGQEYAYHVLAENVAGESDPSENASAETYHEPTPPRSTQADDGPGAGEITVSWKAPTDPGSPHPSNGSLTLVYHVERNASSADRWTRIAEDLTETTYTDTGLDDGAQYAYRIVAENDQAGESDPSEDATETTYKAPTKVQNLSSESSETALQINVSWAEPSSAGDEDLHVANYTISRSPAFDDGPQTIPGTSLEDADVKCGLEYTYEVVARNNVSLVSAPNSTSQEAADLCPSMPTSLQPDGGVRYVDLTWTEPPDPPHRYEVLATNETDSSGSPTGFEHVANVTEPSFNHTGLDDDTTYHYRVRSANTFQGVDYTSANVTGQATTLARPSAPQNLSALAANGASVLVWNPPESNGGEDIDRYTIYRTNGTNQSEVASVSAEPTLASQDLGVTQTEPVYIFVDNRSEQRTGQSYTYNVTAENAVGEGAAASAETNPTVNATCTRQANGVDVAGQGVTPDCEKTVRTNTAEDEYYYLETGGNAVCFGSTNDGEESDGSVRIHGDDLFGLLGIDEPTGIFSDGDPGVEDDTVTCSPPVSGGQE